MDVFLGGKSEPDGCLSNRRLLGREQVLLAVLARFRSRLLDVRNKRFAGFERLIRVEGDRGISRRRQCC